MKRIDTIDNIPQQGHFLVLINKTRYHPGDHYDPGYSESYIDVLSFDTKSELEDWVLSSKDSYQILHATPLAVTIQATVHLNMQH